MQTLSLQRFDRCLRWWYKQRHMDFWSLAGLLKRIVLRGTQQYTSDLPDLHPISQHRM